MHFMCIADSGAWRAVWVAAALALPAIVAHAHPVAQGAMEITISADRLTVRASVTLEEVLVASAYGPGNQRAKSPAEAAQQHGPYLVGHLHVSADGRQLRGRLSSAPKAIQQQPNRFSYILEYPLERPASEFHFEEN